MKLINLFLLIFLFFFSFFNKGLLSLVADQTDDVDNRNFRSSMSSPNIKVSSLEKPSLGSLGVETKLNKVMDLNIWSGMSASNIVKHFNYIPDVVSSKNLQSTLLDLYLTTSNPPSGSSDEIIKFLETRLVKIKTSGESEKLYQLVKQLPEGKRWSVWKKWLVEYELITRQDKKACKKIFKKSKNNSNHFWQSARIFCLAINNKLSQAQFIIDLLKTRDFSDPIFENLFQVMTGDKDAFQIENNQKKILPIHLIMMDTLKMAIKVNFVAHFSIEYTDPLLSLTYLTPEARSFLLDKKISYSHVSSNEIINGYKAISNGNENVESAISIYIKKPNGQSRANVWLSILTLQDDIKKAKSILNFLNYETKAGRFFDSASIYLPILEQINGGSLTKELNEEIEKIKVTYNPSLYENNNLANILMLKKDEEWDWEIILKEKAWQIIPIIEKAGMKEPSSINWLNYLDKFNEIKFDEVEFDKWNTMVNVNTYTLAKGIEEAANKNNKSLTILLVARMIGNNSLIDVDLNNLVIIRSALTKIGFNDLADKLTHEIMASKLLNY